MARVIKIENIPPYNTDHRTMRRATRLEDFGGFQVQPGGIPKSFNPFRTELNEDNGPKRTLDVVQAVRRGVENILDAPEGAPAEPIALFPQASAEPVAAAAAETADAVIPMIQPRAKDGQRLLYKHPKLPRVGAKGAYWLLVGQSDRSEAAWLLQFDGAANPNPGPASSGAVLWGPPGLDGRRSIVCEMGKYLGKATNNIAEVQGLLLGLKIAVMRGARELLIEGDSELIIFQQTGKYRVSDRNLKVWWSEIQAAMMDETVFDWIAIRQVPRELNQRADGVTKEVLSRKEPVNRVY